jgi:hypothetical protein
MERRHSCARITVLFRVRIIAERREAVTLRSRPVIIEIRTVLCIVTKYRRVRAVGDPTDARPHYDDPGVPGQTFCGKDTVGFAESKEPVCGHCSLKTRKYMKTHYPIVHGPHRQ